MNWSIQILIKKETAKILNATKTTTKINKNTLSHRHAYYLLRNTNCMSYKAIEMCSVNPKLLATIQTVAKI